MNIFTKMRQSLLIAAALCCAGGTFAQDYSPVWTNNFEDANTFNQGWKVNAGGRYEQVQDKGYQDGSLALKFNCLSSNNGTTWTYTPVSGLSEAMTKCKEEYQFDFFYYFQAGNNNSSTVTFSFTSGYVNFIAPKNGNASIYVNNDTQTVGTAIPNKTWCHIYFNSQDGKVTLTVTDLSGETTYVENEIIAETAVVLSKITLITGRYWSYFYIDDMTLSAPGAKEDITDPSASVTSVNGVSRTVTIVPGKGAASGNVGTTYYTTDSSDPSSTNGTLYENPIEISSTTTLKFISYLSDGTASNIGILEVEAGTEISLSEEIINVVGFSENGDVLNPIIGNVYNKNSVLLSPEVELTVTFNGNKVDLPYTVTENGTIEATVTAAGYVTASESYTLQAAYTKTHFVDFTTTTDENITEMLGDTWSITATNTRWSNWDKTQGDIYSIAQCSAPANLTDFLGTRYGGNLIVGYGVGRNTDKGTTEFWINNSEEGQIAIYEVNEARKTTTDFVKYGVLYADNNKLSHTLTGTIVIAKVALYSPVRELTVTDGVDLDAEGTYTSASYVRQFNTDFTYGTICLPFAPDAATCANYTFYKLAEANAETLVFEEEAEPKANVAYLYKLNDGVDAESAKTFTGGMTTISDVAVEGVGGWQFVGSFVKTKYEDLSDGLYYAYTPTAEKNILTKAKNSLTVYPYRAYFKFVETEELNFTPAAATMRMIIGGKDDGAMEIQEVIAPEQIEGAVFDLEGRPVEQMQKGQIYIVGGKKVMK